MVSISNKDGLLMPGMNGEVTIKAADLKNVLQVPIDAIRATNELAPVSRMFSISVDTLTSQLRRDLVATEGKTGIPGRYVVVELPTTAYEMRLVKTGPTDLRSSASDGRPEGRRQGRDARRDPRGEAGGSAEAQIADDMNAALRIAAGPGRERRAQQAPAAASQRSRRQPSRREPLSRRRTTKP